MNKLLAKSLLLLILAALLSACAQKGPQKEKILTLDEIDAITPGIAKLVTINGTLDLNDPRVLCRKMRQTGSNIIQMVCITMEERDAMAKNAEYELALMQDEWERRYDVSARPAPLR